MLYKRSFVIASLVLIVRFACKLLNADSAVHAPL